MEHILVPVDFSPDSEKALNVAACEARLRDAKVTLLHVVESISRQDLELYPAIIGQDDVAREREAKERLLEVGQKYFSGVRYETLVRRSVGAVYNEIVSIESDLPISLIVMSVHTRSFFEKLFLESTSNKVINSSRCPVLVVPV